MVPAVASPMTQRVVRFVEICPQCDQPMEVEAELCARGIIVEIQPCVGCGFDAGVAEYDLARSRAALLFVDGAA